MKKLLKLSTLALALAGLMLTSCASTGAKASDAPASTHPREYTLDLAESRTGLTIKLPKNQYDDTNYQSDPAADFYKNVKKDKPQAGDVVHLYFKFSSDIDIPQLKFSLIDPTVNYWLELAPDGAIYFDDIKAGEVYEGCGDIELTTSASGDFKVYLTYDNKDQIDNGYGPVKAPATITLYDIEDVVTTDVEKELPATEATGPKVTMVNIHKINALCDIVTGHPWINGVQNMKEIENYQADISIMPLLDDAPQPGDIIKIRWVGTPDIDIPALYIFPVDHSKEVGWWKELVNDRSPEKITIGTDLKKGEQFDLSIEFVLDVEAYSRDVNLRVFYDYDAESNGPGPCTIRGNPKAE